MWLFLTLAPLLIFSGGEKKKKRMKGEDGWEETSWVTGLQMDLQGLKSCVSSSRRDVIRPHRGNEKHRPGISLPHLRPEPLTSQTRDCTVSGGNMWSVGAKLEWSLLFTLVRTRVCGLDPARSASRALAEVICTRKHSTLRELLDPRDKFTLHLKSANNSKKSIFFFKYKYIFSSTLVTLPHYWVGMCFGIQV